MKFFRKVSIFILIALGIQTAILLYLNNFYFKSSSTVIASSNYNTGSNKNTKKDDSEKEKWLTVDISQSAGTIKASYDGKYMAYKQDSNLYILNLNDGKRNIINFKTGSELTCYTWAEDKDALVIGEKREVNGGGVLKLSMYDAEAGKNTDLKDISWLGNNVSLEDINFGSSSDELFIKIKDNKGKDFIYHIGTEEKKLQLLSSVIGNYISLGDADKLAYETGTDNKFYITGEKNPISIAGENSIQLVAKDNDDKLYIANVENDKATKLFVKDLKSKQNVLTTRVLPFGVEQKDIKITKDGRIYVNNAAENYVLDVNTNKNYKYSGKLVDYYENGIIINKDNKYSKIDF